ncbi:MAG: sigma-70 family RNA polymerase sigma factor [Caldilineaceae bacterium]|nr:sigma-70 family RNA polymerase sigma factor [Caldilineaceae bacterium]
MVATLELSPPHFSNLFRPAAYGTRSAPVLSTDEELAIAQTLQGDIDAFNALVKKYERLAYRVAYRLLQSREAASDAVQESFLKAFRALASFNHGSFKSWLLRIVMNTCYDYLRHDRRLPTDLLSDEPYGDDDEGHANQVADPHGSPLNFVERQELRERIELGLRALPVEQRSALVLADIHGYSYQEISEITGMSLGTVKSRISRARVRMRDFLLQQPELLAFEVHN